MPQDLPRTCYFQVSYTCPIHNISYNVYSVLSTGGDGVSFTYHVYLTLHHTMYLPCSAAQLDCTWSCPACRHLTLPYNRPAVQHSWIAPGAALQPTCGAAQLDCTWSCTACRHLTPPCSRAAVQRSWTAPGAALHADISPCPSADLRCSAAGPQLELPCMPTSHHALQPTCGAAQLDRTWSCPACRHLTLPCSRPAVQRRWTAPGAALRADISPCPAADKRCSAAGPHLELPCVPTSHPALQPTCGAAQLDRTWSCPACRHLTLPCSRQAVQPSWTAPGAALRADISPCPAADLRCSPAGPHLELPCVPTSHPAQQPT